MGLEDWTVSAREPGGKDFKVLLKGKIAEVRIQGPITAYDELPPANGESTVSSIDQLKATAEAAAQGEHVILKNGNYNNPTSYRVRAGVIVRAESVGGVTLTGQPITPGDLAWLYGFNLKNAAPSVAFSPGANSTFKRCFVNLANAGSSKWFAFGRPDVTLDHCEIFGKNTSDELMSNASTAAVRMKILYCHIHDISASANEMMTLGHSSLANWNNQAEFSHCRIERVNISDIELISFKSSGAFFHDCTVLDSTSKLTFRQSNLNRFEDNILIRTAFRMYGHAHEVRRNQIIDPPRTSNYPGGLFIGAGNAAEYPNASNAVYGEVRDCTFEENIIVLERSPSPVGLVLGGGGYPMAPRNNIFRRNIVYGISGVLTDAQGSASWSAQTLDDNIVYAQGAATNGDMPADHFDPKLVKRADGSYGFLPDSPLQWTQGRYLAPSDVGPFAP